MYALALALRAQVLVVDLELSPVKLVSTTHPLQQAGGVPP